MEKVRRDLTKAKIYALRDDRTDKILYVGSTCKDKVSDRLEMHIKDSKKVNGGQLSLYTHIDDWDFIDVMELEKCNVTSYSDLLKREDHFIKELKPLYNIRRNHTSEAEKVENRKKYRKKNGNVIKAYMKEYRQLDSSKQSKVIQDAKYYEANKDTLKDKFKNNYLNNKENIDNKAKEYYENNKDIIKEKLKVKKHCDICDCDVRKADFTRHTKMQKHLNNLK